MRFAGAAFCLMFFSLPPRTSAESMVLQNGLNGYKGCEDTYIGDKDISPFGAAKILRTEKGP